MDERLTDSELAELVSFPADDSAAKSRLPAVACEGFLMGVISSPDMILPSEWLPIVLGSSDAPAFEDMVSAKRITSLIMRWYNQILDDLDHGEDEVPLSIADENGELSPGAAIIWAIGYFEAMMLRLDSWESFEAEPEGELLEPIFTLLGCRDKPKNWKRKATSAAKRLPECIGEIYEYWLEQRSQPKRRAAPKIGRNDPCSCGSGKKFKRCCGAA